MYLIILWCQELELKVMHMLDKRSATKLYPWCI